MLEIENLSVSLGPLGDGTPVLEGINLTLQKGLALGIVGESGCGKSTLASAIVGLLPPVMNVRGKVFLKGENLIFATPERLRQVRHDQIAFIPQDPSAALNPLYKIGNQLSETMSGTRQSRSGRALSLLQEVRVTAADERLGAYPHMLSGGIKQRVIGAMGLASEPDLVIADEPTTALDVTVQAEYLKLLNDLRQKRGFGLILISHDLGVVASVCDHVAVMYAGRIVEHGPMDQVFGRPVHPYTRSLLKARPSVDHDIEWLETIAGEPPVLGRWPKGCRFAPRCPQAVASCEEEEPKQVTTGPSASAACIFAQPYDAAFVS